MFHGIYSKVNMVSTRLQAPGLFMTVYCRYYPDAASCFETEFIAAALLFGFLRSGGINMEMVAGVPTALVMVIQGLIVVSLAGAAFFMGRRA